MKAVYTYRMQQYGMVQTEECTSVWDALARAQYDLEHQSDLVVPVSITSDRCIFHYGHLLVLLDYDRGDSDTDAIDASDPTFAAV